MQTIHFKTTDPVSQELLGKASQKGLDLNWERYEKQQPQDGFLRVGLSCPYGCMQGPCRIDPYGRWADRGICGLDRDGMTAAFVLRLALQGIMETMAAIPADQTVAELHWTEPFDKMAAAALERFGGSPLSIREIFSSVAMLARPSATPEALVHQALRLGILGIGLAEQVRKAENLSGPMRFQCGYGLLNADAVLIGVAGRISRDAAQELIDASVGLKDPAVQMVSLGEWIPAGESFLPIAATTAEMETVLSSGKFSLLLAGSQSDPGLLQLCDRLKISVVCCGDNLQVAEVLEQARKAFRQRPPVSFNPEAALISEGTVCCGGEELQAFFDGASSAKIFLVGGSDTLFQTLGQLPVNVAKTLQDAGHKVAAWGDAALWMARCNLPAGILEAWGGPLAAVHVLAGAGRLADLKGICFTGLRDCREFTFALGLAALGLKVSAAVPLPVWGSAKVREMLRENLSLAGGALLYFDHPAQADEILEGLIQS